MRVLFLVLLLFGGFAEANSHVLVSIVPQKFLVERIGGDYVTISVIVPPGANSHTYEPTPKQVVTAQKGKIWFRLGESFETRMIPSLEKNTRIIDQRVGIELIQTGCGCCNAKDAHDPHIWLSPKLLKKQAAQIAQVLSEHDPEHMKIFAHNLGQLEQELDLLDQECATLLARSPQRHILVSHPAFGYFCRDYNLEQISIEMEGREPTPRHLTDLIQKAKGCEIKMVFLQKQHNPRGGKRIAKELKAATCFVDPYEENVIENLRTLANLFASS